MSNERIDTHESNESTAAKAGAPGAWADWSASKDEVSEVVAIDEAVEAEGAETADAVEEAPASAAADQAESADEVEEADWAADQAESADAAGEADVAGEAAEVADEPVDQTANTAEHAADQAPKAPAGFDNYDFNVAGAYAPNGVISRNAPRQLNPFGKAIACVLSVLVALTTWNASSIEVAREMIIGDDATPMAAGDGDTLLDDVDEIGRASWRERVYVSV